MEKRFSKKYISLVKNIIEDSGLIDEDIVSSLVVRENPFSDQIDVGIDFHLSSDIGRSYVDELVDNIWDFIHGSLNIAVAIHTNWNELIKVRKQPIVTENFDLWLRRRIKLIEGIFIEVLKELSSKRNLSDYFSRITFTEFVDVVFNQVLDEIHYMMSNGSSVEKVPYEKIHNYLENTYKDNLKRIWVQNKKS
jgi:hypothetical protein